MTTRGRSAHYDGPGERVWLEKDGTVFYDHWFGPYSWMRYHLLRSIGMALAGRQGGYAADILEMQAIAFGVDDRYQGDDVRGPGQAGWLAQEMAKASRAHPDAIWHVEEVEA